MMNKGDLVFRHPKLLIPLNVMLAFLALIFMLFLTRDILAVISKKNAKPFLQAHSGPQKIRKGLYEYAGILEHNPFGFPGGQLRELSASKEGAISHSDLTLIGTVSGPANRSYAIFSDKSGKQEVFKVGESVFGAGRLRGVGKDSVVIREGRKEIKIPIAELVAIKEVNPAEGSTASEFARNIGRGTFIVDQKKVLNALENPNQLMTDARLQPNVINGKQEGFTLREVRNGGIYQSLGLQNGDVLLRINDYNISNPETSLQAFTALRGMDRVQIDIVRNGTKMTMTYQIR